MGKEKEVKREKTEAGEGKSVEIEGGLKSAERENSGCENKTWGNQLRGDELSAEEMGQRAGG